jgi:hypothetical protein
MAAVTPVGSQIYVNQASPLVSQIHQSVAQRFDMQAFVVAEAEKNKEAKIEPVSEADGTHKINADGDNGKNSEQYRPEKKEKEEDEEAEEPHKSDHILDLKV